VTLFCVEKINVTSTFLLNYTELFYCFCFTNITCFHSFHEANVVINKRSKKHICSGYLCLSQTSLRTEHQWELSPIQQPPCVSVHGKNGKNLNDELQLFIVISRLIVLTLNFPALHVN